MNTRLSAALTTKKTQRVVILTAIALTAFAANSVLCRVALRHSAIDPISFSVIRLVSGALILWVILKFQRPVKKATGSWGGAVSLYVYAFAFSYAYLKLDTGTGALVLFGAVQLTMLGYGVLQGERMGVLALLGLVLAVTGLVVLLLPGSSAPPLTSVVIMLTSGVAWGVYSILGKSLTDPLAATAGNFMMSVPLIMLTSLPFISSFHADVVGITSAVVSGTIASGAGYAIWYAAVRNLSSFRAATVQLTVPVIASIAGVLLLGETFTTRLGLSSLTVLGGIALVLSAKQTASLKPRD
ncbi:DMT family transporter [Pseudomonas qingdaonensis]|uniref:DMT family transporter n=1 Tax=Pseudomonas qingdaonensis TaxID=2056231 RepID=A0ABX8DKZ0_9PSED|nr:MULTISPECIES: DMT family transporter [Pseudomonas]MDD1955682.1 DMT family transporter [Pseudomonas sp. 8209]MEC6743564.1 DMT family transporter [Pseudomonas qingdaonensis]PPS62412.1 EamA family transporter [Pseudomonas sp. BRM28]QVL16937.1 DMT family transporter [Pseudomonas qingdaonensis]